MKTEKEIREAMEKDGVIDTLIELIDPNYKVQVKNLLINQLRWVLED